MRIAVAADERTGVADDVVRELRARNREPLPSLRAISQAELAEILDAWFATGPSADEDDAANVAHVDDIR
jgi:hypothetical protein